MTARAAEAYSQLASSFARRHKLQHAVAMLNWDAAVNLSPGSAPARGAAVAELEVLVHDELVKPANVSNLEVLKNDPSTAAALTDLQRANLREMRRAVDAEAKLPAELVARRSALTTEAEMAWRAARKNNDWKGFEPTLVRLFDIARETGDYLKQGTSLTTYEALLDQFEPGMREADCDALFSNIKSWLPAHLKKRLAAQPPKLPLPQGKTYPVEKQKELGREVATLLGFDFARGRVDVSSHPMCAGVPEDVRMTNRYDEADFQSSVMGVVHETGHSVYEQHRPATNPGLDQPASLARSMGVHESQSLFHEMQMGRSLPFMQMLAPLLRKHLGLSEDETRPEDMLQRALFVECGKIRVDADELTYPLHVALRYDIEKAVIEKKLAVADIPRVWDEKMMEYLAVDTKGDFANGVLQDIHWCGFAAIGYFATYSLGAAIAAQLMAACRKDLGSEKVDADIAAGKFGDIQKWLDERIWKKGSILETPQLLKEATGSTFDPSFYKAHLLSRYPA